MAKGNLYSAYKAAGTAAGKYQGSWQAQEGIRGEMTAESMLSDLKVQGIQDTTAAVTEAIGLAQSYRDERTAEKEHKELMSALGDDSTKVPDTDTPTIAEEVDLSPVTGGEETVEAGTTGAGPDITKKKLGTELAVHSDSLAGKIASTLGIGGEKKKFAETSPSEKTEKGTDIIMTAKESLKKLSAGLTDEKDDEQDYDEYVEEMGFE